MSQPCIKRRAPDGLSEAPGGSKRYKHEICSSFQLLAFSDCVLLHILQYCDATTLYNLSQVCERLKYLVEDERLWVLVDTRHSPDTPEKIKFCEDRLNSRTISYQTTSDRRSAKLLTANFFERASICTKLTILALENQTINGNLTFKMYPPTLQEVSFRKSYITSHKTFFRHVDHTLKDLRVLIMDQCQWLEAESLPSFGNLPNLEILSLYMCKKITDDHIGYISLCGRFGFKKLKILNVRFTGLGNSFVSSMYRSSSLQELYFHNYCYTYRLDRFKRKIDILKGAEMFKNSYLSEDDENVDMNVNEFKEKYGKGDYFWDNMDYLSDDSFHHFHYVKTSTEAVEPAKNSVLFRPPYEQCTCQSDEEKKTEISLTDTDSSDDDDCSSNLRTVAKKLSHEHRLRKHYMCTNIVPSLNFIHVLGNVPNNVDIFEATPENKNRNWILYREPLNDYEISMLEHTHNNGLLYRPEPPNYGKYLSITICPFIHQNAEFELELQTVRNVFHYDPDNNENPRPRITHSRPRARNDVDVPFVHISFNRESGSSSNCNLKKLSLRGYPNITDRTLRYISHLDLELLDVMYTDVTEGSVRRFQSLHPNCRVIHESACTCGPNMHF